MLYICTADSNDKSTVSEASGVDDTASKAEGEGEDKEEGEEGAGEGGEGEGDVVSIYNLILLISDAIYLLNIIFA